MKAKCLNEAGDMTWAVILDRGDEVLDCLSGFAERHELSAGRVTGIGAFSRATLGFFDRESKDYVKIEIDEQTEVLSMLGDIALADGKPKLHLHVVLGKRDGSAHGGHLLAGSVWPTLEVIITESPSYLKRTHDAETGLPLIDISP